MGQDSAVRSPSRNHPQGRRKLRTPAAPLPAGEAPAGRKWNRPKWAKDFHFGRWYPERSWDAMTDGGST
jgi:hypothetical protein